MAKSYYHIGLDVPGWGSLKNKIRREAEAGARKGVEKEIPRIRREVREEATRAVAPVARREAAIGAKAAVKPLVVTSIAMSVIALLVSLVKR